MAKSRLLVDVIYLKISHTGEDKPRDLVSLACESGLRPRSFATPSMTSKANFAATIVVEVLGDIVATPADARQMLGIAAR